MGNLLIVKGADFSENSIKKVDVIQLVKTTVDISVADLTSHLYGNYSAGADVRNVVQHERRDVMENNSYASFIMDVRAGERIKVLSATDSVMISLCDVDTEHVAAGTDVAYAGLYNSLTDPNYIEIEVEYDGCAIIRSYDKKAVQIEYKKRLD